MANFTIEMSGKFTSTKVEVDTWPEVEAAAARFINATTDLPETREALLAWVLDEAGKDFIMLPNGKKLAIY